MRDGAEEVGVKRHGETREHGRRAGRDHHRHERGGQRGDLRGLRGEQVVDAEVARVKQDEHLAPSEGRRGQRARDGVGEEVDEAHGVELRGHADEHREPQEGIPRALLVEAVLPGDDAGHELQRHAEHRRGDRAHPDLIAEDPENHGEAHRDDDHDLILRERAELLELLRRLLRGLRSVLDLGRVHLEHEQRRHRQPDDGGNARRFEPREPRGRDDDAEGRGELQGQ
mmetsp:Transcript_2680/g.12101  ORF Transcript_2680/g.12101 Transcript_2680/m.12101 type:complete len:227 (-) Transcript_2680:878-1558(-)